MQLLSSAAGSRSDTHSDSSDFKCKLFLFADFFFFLAALLLLPLLPFLPITQTAPAPATKLPTSYTRLQERNGQTKGDSR